MTNMKHLALTEASFFKFDFDHWASIRIILVSLIMHGIFQLLIGGHTVFGFLTAAVSCFLLSSLATVACEFPFTLCLPLTILLM